MECNHIFGVQGYCKKCKKTKEEIENPSKATDRIEVELELNEGDTVRSALTIVTTEKGETYFMPSDNATLVEQLGMVELFKIAILKHETQA